MPKTIDITPDWAPLIPLLCEILKNPEADEIAKRDIESELVQLAREVDKRNHARIRPVDRGRTSASCNSNQLN